jgi:hypothetical protein
MRLEGKVWERKVLQGAPGSAGWREASAWS